MKKAIVSILLFLGVLCCLLALSYLWMFGSEWSSHRKHAQLIERAFNNRLIPACDFVRDFVEREHRLPSDSEMEGINQGKTGWDIVTIIRERPPWLASWGVPGRDFIVTTSEPEWNLYYCSWNGEHIESWTD